ncbi:MAG TPA: sigma-70 family RNA polymerase sigma factor, partial [Xanthomonadales bacterium]|nr:sigma-70 family RNA polymerase sigma factor [Xanthomonadales bacterium]
MAALAHDGIFDDDAILVAQSVAGSRSAFARIVARYQQLVCSVAYSATGSVSRSEDLAQETFIAAWRQLAELREPERLRAWLCGIARNLAHNVLRRDGREPATDADSIDTALALPAEEASPSEHAMQAEEQAILWRAIARIPETYREPLVLFYREHQSIERVAASLDLTEDAVRQRLSRGRKLLQEEVLAFVEGALGRSGPGSAFTLAVMASIPAAGVSTPATAAVVGSAAAKTGAGVLLALAGPVVSTISMYYSVRSGLDSAPTPRERALV